MSKPSLVGALAILLPLALLACASDDDGSGNYTNIPAGFSKYCTGTLIAGQELMEPYGSGWMGGMDSPEAAAGSVFVVGDDFHGLAGYVFTAKGEPLMISPPDGTALVKGTDFTSECGLEVMPLKTESVLLSEVTLYANEALTGTACKVPAATTLTNYSFYNMLSKEIARVSSDEIKQLCGWDEAYGKNFLEATLVLK